MDTTTLLIQKLAYLKDRVQLMNRLLVAQRDSLRVSHGIAQPAETDLFDTLNTVRVGLNEIAQMVIENERELKWQKILADIRVKQERGTPLPSIIADLFEQLGAKRSLLILKDNSGAFEMAGLPKEDIISQTIVREVGSSGAPILTTNAQQDDRFAGQHSITSHQLSSIAAIPVKSGEETVGVLYLDKPIRSGIFSENDMTLLKKIAGELGGMVKPYRARDTQPLETWEEDTRTAVGGGVSPDDNIYPSPPISESVGPGAAFPVKPIPKIEDEKPDLLIFDEEEAEDDETTQIPRITQPIEFSAYYPTEVTPGNWHTFYAYIFRQFAAPLVEADVKGELGGKMPLYRQAGQSFNRALEEGTLITATPTLPGFQFNPPSVNIGFYDDWQRFDFKMRVKDAVLEHSANGWLTFTAMGIIIAEIPLSVFVTRKVRDVPMSAANPKPYSAVFCSYSHRDTPIVERVERALKALGLDYLRDIQTLKSGQDWDDQLYSLIDQADIFQLFWSEAARKSPYVEKEWRHALKQTDRANFIRPVYWDKPIPFVPSELGHIHFAYQPDLDA